MSTDRKSESARINGAKSKGPVTPAGKAKSSRNALSHGLTANYAVVGEESQADFHVLLHAYVDRYQPSDAVETELVHTLAITRWRLRRVATLETCLFENDLALRGDEIDESFESLDEANRVAYVFQKQAEEGKALSLLIRYEAALNRVYDRTLKQLDQLQTGPRRNEPTEQLNPDPPPTSPAEPEPQLESENETRSPEIEDRRESGAKAGVGRAFAVGSRTTC